MGKTPFCLKTPRLWSAGRMADNGELARLRAEIERLRAENVKLRGGKGGEPPAVVPPPEEVVESGRPGRLELLAKKDRIVGGVGCPPNCRTSGKPRGR